MQRTSIRYLPNEPVPCRVERPCVYRDRAGICDTPRVNKGNGDAACHRMPNRVLVRLVEKIGNEK